MEPFETAKTIAENTPTEGKPKKGNFFIETLKFIGITLLIVIPFRYFIAQPFIVSGESMYPTFENGEYLIVDELSYRFSEPKRGDVIIFRYPLDTKKFFIKRIIGLPGEKIEMNGLEINITKSDGQTITWAEPYIQNKKADFFNINLKSDEYFVLGDNRPASSDSRVWGSLPKDDIIGRPFVRLLPPSKIDLFPGLISQDENTKPVTAQSIE